MPLHFVNVEISPGVKVAGGIVEYVMKELEISCLPKDLPEFIQVDLANLQAGHSLHLSHVALPPGVEADRAEGRGSHGGHRRDPEGDDGGRGSGGIAAATAIVSAADVPTTAQKAKEEEGGGRGGWRQGSQARGREGRQEKRRKRSSE